MMQINQRGKLHLLSLEHYQMLITQENTLTLSNTVHDILIINTTHLH